MVENSPLDVQPKIHFTIEIIVEPDDDGFHAFCPALKGLHVGGDTEEEALKNAFDGSILYLESLKAWRSDTRRSGC